MWSLDSELPVRSRVRQLPHPGEWRASDDEYATAAYPREAGAADDAEIATLRGAVPDSSTLLDRAVTDPYPAHVGSAVVDFGGASSCGRRAFAV